MEEQVAEIVQESVLEVQVSKISEFFKNFTNPHYLVKVAIVIGALLLLCLIYIVLKKILTKIPDEKLKPQIKRIILTTLKYMFEVFVVIYILNLLGVNLNALFGAAGILGVAVGLAAQTSLGNIISGLFLLHEHSLKIGDHIIIDGTEGNIDSIDLLAIKVKTFDNQIVRVPNETLIKSNFENLSVLPQRRICLYITISLDEDLSFVMTQLEKAAKETNLVLAKPSASVVCSDFTSYGAQLRIAAWAKYANFVSAKSNLIVKITDECKKMNVKVQCPLVEVKDDGEKQRENENDK